MNNDLISREALKKAVQDYADDQYAENEYLGEYAIMDIIDKAPAVEYTFEEAFQKAVCEQRLYCPARPKGKWLKFGVIGLKACYKCSICGRYAVDNIENNVTESYPFCHCGADMRKETKEDNPCPCIECTSTDKKRDCQYCKAWAKWSLE